MKQNKLISLLLDKELMRSKGLQPKELTQVATEAAPQLHAHHIPKNSRGKNARKLHEHDFPTLAAAKYCQNLETGGLQDPAAKPKTAAKTKLNTSQVRKAEAERLRAKAWELRKARRNDAVTLKLSPKLETVRRAQLNLGTVATATVKKLRELVEGLPEKVVDDMRRDTKGSCYIQFTLGACSLLSGVSLPYRSPCCWVL